MLTPSIEGLVAFINDQPADRAIKSHRSWNECAVGDYAREVLGHEIPLAHLNDSYAAVHADPVLNALFRECGTEDPNERERNLGIPQSDGFSLMDILAGMDGPESYGDLAALVNDPDSWD